MSVHAVSGDLIQVFRFAPDGVPTNVVAGKVAGLVEDGREAWVVLVDPRDGEQRDALQVNVSQLGVKVNHVYCVN